MKLQIELVPSSAFFQNFRNEHPERWKKIKQECYKKAGYKCEICGEAGSRWPVESHEVWAWEDGVQRLVRLEALCPACHLVKHIGLAQIKGRALEAKAHLMRINGIGNDEAAAHIKSAFLLWRERCDQEWTMDCSILEGG